MIGNFLHYDFLQYTWWNNTVSEYIDMVIYFLILLVVLYIVQRVLIVRFATFAKRSKTEVDDVVVDFIKSIKPQLYFTLAIYVALRTITVSHLVQEIIDALAIVIVIYQVTKSLQIIIEFVAKKLSDSDSDEHAKSAAHLLGTIATITIWIFGIIMILSNVGVNVTSLVAGVGIGGIAIAFAVKEILADLFASFAIYFDKPFRAGDIVKVDDELGTVQKIGIKTTRIKSRTGEQMIISNQEMTSARVHNFKRMESRNVKFKFVVEFDTPVEKLQIISEKIPTIVEGVENVEFKRAHLKEFGDWGFVFEVAFVVNSREYGDYMDAQQKINFGIAQMLNEMSVTLAVMER